MSIIIKPEALGVSPNLFIKSESDENNPLPEMIIENLGGKLIGTLREDGSELDLADVWLGIVNNQAIDMLVTNANNNRDFQTLIFLEKLKAIFLIGEQDPAKIQRLTHLVHAITTKHPQAPIMVIANNVTEGLIKTLREDTDSHNIVNVTPKDISMIVGA